MKRTFWDKHRFKVSIGIILAFAVIMMIFVGIPYLEACSERGGFMFGGKSSLCWTPEGILWPWEIYN